MNALYMEALLLMVSAIRIQVAFPCDVSEQQLNTKGAKVRDWCYLLLFLLTYST